MVKKGVVNNVKSVKIITNKTIIMSKEKMNELDLFRYELIFDGTTGEEFAKSIGMSYPSYKNVVRNGSKVIPKWVLSFLFGRGYSYVGDALIKKPNDNPNKFGSPSYAVKYGTSTTGVDVNSVTYSGSSVEGTTTGNGCKSIHGDGSGSKVM